MEKMDREERANRWRLILYFLVLGAILLFALSILPSSLRSIVIKGVLLLPLALYLIDKPKLVYYILLFIHFSNLDAFAPFRFYRFVLLFCILALVLAVVRGKRIIMHDKAFAYLIVAFLIVGVQSFIGARDAEGGLVRFQFLLKYMVFLFLSIQFVTDRKELRRMFVVIAVALAMKSFLPFVVSPPEQYASPSFVWSEGVIRYEGFEFEPNTFALMQIFFIPVLLFTFYIFRRKLFIKVLVVLAILGSVTVLILSFSRGGFVTLVFLLVCFLIVERRNKTILTAGILLIIAGIIMAPSTYWRRIGSLFNALSNVQQFHAIASRLGAIRASIDLGLKHPIFGIGIGNFPSHTPFYMPLKITVHNAFLEVFSELGLIGIFVFFLLFLYNIIVLKRLSRLDDDEASQLGRILLVLYLSVFVNGLFIPIAYEFITWFVILLPTLSYRAYLSESTGKKKSLLL